MEEKKNKLLHEDLTYKLIGIFFKIHKTLGCGFPEKIYQKAITIELEKENIKYQTEKQIKVKYENKDAGFFRLDLIIDEKVIIEIKAIEAIAPVHFAQVLTYLKFSDCKLALLINFNTVYLKDGIYRIVNKLN